jgi:hypothetical protein
VTIDNAVELPPGGGKGVGGIRGRLGSRLAHPGLRTRACVLVKIADLARMLHALRTKVEQGA